MASGYYELAPFEMVLSVDLLFGTYSCGPMAYLRFIPRPREAIVL